MKYIQYLIAIILLNEMSFASELYTKENSDKIIHVTEESNQTILTQKEQDWLKSHPTIILGSDESWDPFIIKSKDGIISGFDNDILEMVNKYTGANFQLTAEKWKDILHKAEVKEIDGLSSSAVHKERASHFFFSKSYISLNKVLIVANNNPKNIGSVNDLSGKKIGYHAKNLFNKKLAQRYNNSTIVPIETIKEMLQKLILGEIDVIIGSNTLATVANKLIFPYLKIINQIPDSALDVVFSIRKDYPEAISILNKGLDSISNYEKTILINKWFFKHQKTANFTIQEKEYLQNNPDIHEVIFSGGDPLLLNNQRIQQLIYALSNIPHIQRIRFHTRLPIVLPSRIDSDLISILNNAPLPIVLVTHCNHPNELSDAVKIACLNLKQANISLLNQSVLLKGINDTLPILSSLSEKLFSYGILPYYLHALDKAKGTAHFDLPQKTAIDLHQQLQAQLSGYLVPKLVQEEAGKNSKTLLF